MTRRTVRSIGATPDDLRVVASLEGKPLPSGQALAAALGGSRAAAWARVRRLERLGALRFVTSVQLRPETCECISYLEVHGVRVGDFESLDQRIAADPAIRRASRVTGNFDYRLHSLHADYRSASDWSRSLESHPAVARISTRFCRTVFDREHYAAAILGSD